ncbi:hypothetical protein AHU44_22820 [Salmonella enterica subsp. diarizonae]|nr:hypothetical protein [Salmonella enterica subsp. diarizonae]ECI5214749.1 hypothetical protein [Salmonella enterica subsp. diarizonae]EDL8432106.1 hypothetical protein [Salmonella enterica subsp. diarizonae]EEI3023684.1 hypothetical protein [Salmonella enterica subsp. diarizonae]
MDYITELYCLVDDFWHSVKEQFNKYNFRNMPVRISVSFPGRALSASLSSISIIHSPQTPPRERGGE